MITQNEILNQLRNFKFDSGKPVIVHTSLRAIGEIEGGAQSLLDALIDCFTADNGLLCIPTHTWKSMVLDLNKAESCIGVLPSVAAAHPAGVRSLNPTHSMAVFGDKSRVEDFISREADVDTPTNPDGCYGNLYRENGYVLLIGVGQTKNTYLHCVEEMLGVSCRLTEDKVSTQIIHKDGSRETRKLHWFDDTYGDVSVNFGKFEKAFRHYDCIQDGFIGNAPSQLCQAVKMKNVMELIYKNACGKELLADNAPIDESLYKF